MAGLVTREAVMRLSYGPEDCYGVDFRRDAEGKLEGRYLSSREGLAPFIGEWGPRESHGDSDTQAIIDAILLVLSGYSNVR